MTAPDWVPWLGCPACPQLWEVSEEDPDATLSDVLEHITVKHTGYDHIRALGLLAQTRQLTAEQAAEVRQ